jgi:hypothetical protein
MELLDRLKLVILSRKSECLSEAYMLVNAVRLMESNREDVKAKIELSELGWTAKLKWGGNLTPLGLSQSESAGRHLRLDLHDILDVGSLDARFFASTDTRCQETARSFASAFLRSESVSVRSDDGPDGLGNLDDTPFRHSPLVKSMRTEVSHLLMSGRKIDSDFKAELFNFPCNGLEALNSLGSSHGTFALAVSELKSLIDALIKQLSSIHVDGPLYASESLDLIKSRWGCIHKALHRSDVLQATPRSKWKTQQTSSGVWLTSLQVSLIGDIYDNCQYDYRHNLELFPSDTVRLTLTQIRTLVSKLVAIVIPLEYGISGNDKAFIGSTFLHPLLRKLRFDFRLAANLPLNGEEEFLSKQEEAVAVPGAPARVRLYFAHHSHVYSFVSILESAESIFAKTNLSIDLEKLRHIRAYGYLCELLIGVSKHRFSEAWRMTIHVFPGDAFVDRSGQLTFDQIPIVTAEALSASDIDDIFTAILAIPARNGNVPSHLKLAPIGESEDG